MFSNLSPGAASINANFDQAIALAKRHGFGGVDLYLDDATVADPLTAAKKARDAGLKWGGFGLPTDFRGDEKKFNDGLATLKKLAPAAKKAGCDRCATWLMPCSNELDYKANFDLHVKRLKPVAQVLADNGVRFGLEFVGPLTMRKQFKHEFVHNLDQLLELNAAIGTPNMGLLLDCWHWYTSGATFDDIVKKLPNSKIVYVHVNDAPKGKHRDEQIDSVRDLPCATGVIDSAGFMKALKQVGYDGPITAEPFMPELGKLPPDEAAAKVAAAVKKMMSLA